eukprot:scaffold95715_cov33-Tisochrysis_lutea.AAC.5
MLSRGSRLLLRPLRVSPALRQPHLPLRSLQPPRASLSSSSSPPRDLYEVLGLAKGASAADIKRKYYEKAKQHHPDTNKGDPLAAKKFAEATEAYEVLSDPEKRKAYDTFGHAGINGGVGANGGMGGGFPGGFGAGGFSAGPGGFQWQFRGGNPNEVDFDDLLSQLFGADGRRAQRGPRRGRDVQVRARIATTGNGSCYVRATSMPSGGAHRLTATTRADRRHRCASTSRRLQLAARRRSPGEGRMARAPSTCRSLPVSTRG